VASAEGVQYAIPDSTALDKASRKLLERFVALLVGWRRGVGNGQFVTNGNKTSIPFFRRNGGTMGLKPRRVSFPRGPIMQLPPVDRSPIWRPQGADLYSTGASGRYLYAPSTTPTPWSPWTVWVKGCRQGARETFRSRRPQPRLDHIQKKETVEEPPGAPEGAALQAVAGTSAIPLARQRQRH
jgi:hypothetical protein